MTAPHNAGADLPNAALIDEVLACVAAWGAARAAAYERPAGVTGADLVDARIAARVASPPAVWTAAWGGVCAAAATYNLGLAWETAWDAVTALIAWDDAAQLYPLTPAQLRLSMQLLPAGAPQRHAAALLLPYATARVLAAGAQSAYT